jgi:S-(hydroxymethyl)glutathione dehydrogenase/alcohol dehydrogenase
MKTRAAVLWGLEQKWEVEEVDLDPPGPGEVLVRLAATAVPFRRTSGDRRPRSHCR